MEVALVHLVSEFTERRLVDAGWFDTPERPAETASGPAADAVEAMSPARRRRGRTEAGLALAAGGEERR